MTPAAFIANVARFWDKVDRSGDCWLWTGEKNNQGYGRFELWHNNRRSRVFAHRMVLLLSGRELEDDEVVRHGCDNPPCVNPAHLSTGTQQDNIQDAKERGRSNFTGLAVGQARVWPPRPCLLCGTTVTEGRRRYCGPCKKTVMHESRERWKAKQRERDAATVQHVDVAS